MKPFIRRVPTSAFLFGVVAVILLRGLERLLEIHGWVEEAAALVVVVGAIALFDRAGSSWSENQ